MIDFRGKGGATPGAAEPRLRETVGGSAIVRVDVDGDGTSDIEINLVQVQGLSAAEFGP